MKRVLIVLFVLVNCLLLEGKDTPNRGEIKIDSFKKFSDTSYKIQKSSHKQTIFNQFPSTSNLWIPFLTSFIGLIGGAAVSWFSLNTQFKEKRKADEKALKEKRDDDKTSLENKRKDEKEALENKRDDEKLLIQIKRLDKQLNELYGPLYSLYQIGQAHFEAYSKSANYVSFTDANYRTWLSEVFMKTNIRMEEIIIGNADLFIKKIPKECLDFCKHVTSLKLSLGESLNPEMDYKSRSALDARMKKYKHPGYLFHAYIKTAFEEIKKKQTALLSVSREPVNEEKLYENISENYTLFSQILMLRDMTKSLLSYTPFNLELSTLNNYCIPATTNINTVKIYTYQGSEDEKSIKENYTFKEIIFLNTDKLPQKSELYVRNKSFKSRQNNINPQYALNSKGADILAMTVEHNYNNDTKVCEHLYFDEKHDLMSKSIVTYTSDKFNFNSIIRIKYFEPIETLEYDIKYTRDEENEKKNLVCEKRDINNDSIRYITQSENNLTLEHFNWYDKHNHDKMYLQRVYNREDNLVECIDTDTHTKKVEKISYKLTIKDNLVEYLSMFETNNEQSFKRYFEYL